MHTLYERAIPAAPALVGSGRLVPLVTGGDRPYVNLDHAASAPCLVTVERAVGELLDWYASVHRGAGYLSDVCTRAYEGARVAVAAFAGARHDDVVVFTRNTTDAINLLAAALPEPARVVVFASEHHANLLPWRRRDITVLPVPRSPDEAIARLDAALRGGPRCPTLVAVTGASNVTGEVWPYADLTAVAHRHGARLLLDAAQLAPHHAIDMAACEVDWIALSGHKMYAPFGAGALVGRADWLAAGEPFLAGGGAVRYVGTAPGRAPAGHVTAPSRGAEALDVIWADLPDRAEAGTPNLVGAVALGVACRTLQASDRAAQAAEETRLADRAEAALAAIPGVRRHRMWAPEHPRIGVVCFSLDGIGYATLAAALSAEHGIGVRHGCFCAHPLVADLLGVDDHGLTQLRRALRDRRPVAMPGAVRMSIGLGTTAAGIDRLTRAVAEIAAEGPRWTYRTSADGADARPDPDPRPLPDLPFDLA